MSKILRRPKIRVGTFAVTVVFLATSLLLQLFLPPTRAKSAAPALMKTRSEPILTSTAAQSGCSPSPTMTLLAPLGGEILDTATHFNVSWTVDDPAAVLSNTSIRQSTNGGATFSTIATVPVSQTQYAWTVPSIANNQTVQIEVVGNSNSCNNAPLLESGNLTIWNPGRTLSHVAEAPIFFSGGGFTSTIYLANTSASSVTVELDPHAPNGNGLQKFPAQITLSPGASATVDAASLYTIGTDPQNSLFPAAINGGIRLRHNGSKDTDIRAYIVAQKGSAERFTTQFVYPASSQSSTATMQCAPMYYVDSQTSAFVSFQNATNSPQTVALVCNYGTGASGTPNGQFKNQVISLGPQQTYIVDLKSVASQFDGAVWGSADVFTENPQSVVCHSVMMSPENGIAWDCPFVDPAASVSTTKVADSVMLDYNTAENAYIMVCNMATASRSVTASFNTTTGVSIPAVQVTVPAGGQKIITLNAQQLLVSGTSTTADVRLSYTGSPADIEAAGCSLATASNRAIPVKFKEPSTTDSRRLTSPYFKLDEGTSGKIQISNLGSASIMAGAKMVLANSTAIPLKTPPVTIPPGGVRTIDLSSAADIVPDGTDSTGRVDLVQSGPAGTVIADLLTMDYQDNSGQVVPMDPGPPPDPLTMFTPDSILPGGCTTIDAITDGTITDPCDPVLDSLDGCLGTAHGWVGIGLNVYEATFCVPLACSGSPTDVHIEWQCGSGGGSTTDESDLITPERNFSSFQTDTGNGLRMRPDGSSTFTLTAQAAFPDSLMQVAFSGKGGTVLVNVQGDGQSDSVTAASPVNHTFLGSVKTIVVTQLNPDGTPVAGAHPVLKTKKSGAYFALDPPTAITAITNVTTPGMGSTVPATGAEVKITGTGFQRWDLGTGTVFPTVEIGRSDKAPDQIPFQFESLSGDLSTITGQVGVLPGSVNACCGGQVQTPCKTVTVINPGSPISTNGTASDQTTSAQILSISAPPPPVLSSASPGSSNSLGFQTVRVPPTGQGFPVPVPLPATINGRNLFHVQTVTFGAQGTPIAIGPSNISANGKTITNIFAPPFCLSGASASVPITVDDGCNTPVSLANAWTYIPTDPIVADFSSIEKVIAITGKCESMSAATTTFSIPGVGSGFLDREMCTFTNEVANALCATLSSPTFVQTTSSQSPLFPDANFGIFTWGADCSNCTVASGTTVTGYFKLTITNLNSNHSVNRCLSASCTK